MKCRHTDSSQRFCNVAPSSVTGKSETLLEPLAHKSLEKGWATRALITLQAICREVLSPSGSNRPPTIGGTTVEETCAGQLLTSAGRTAERVELRGEDVSPRGSESQSGGGTILKTGATRNPTCQTRRRRGQPQTPDPAGNRCHRRFGGIPRRVLWLDQSDAGRHDGQEKLTIRLTGCGVQNRARLPPDIPRLRLLILRSRTIIRVF